jgi:hypothetical protein
MRRPTRAIGTPSLALVIFAAAALAGCNTDGAGSMAQSPEPKPMTHQRAAAICWEKTEKDAGKMTLDKRADVVTTCTTTG